MATVVSSLCGSCMKRSGRVTIKGPDLSFTQVDEAGNPFFQISLVEVEAPGKWFYNKIYFVPKESIPAGGRALLEEQVYEKLKEINRPIAAEYLNELEKKDPDAAKILLAKVKYRPTSANAAAPCTTSGSTAKESFKEEIKQALSVDAVESIEEVLANMKISSSSQAEADTRAAERESRKFMERALDFVPQEFHAEIEKGMDEKLRDLKENNLLGSENFVITGAAVALCDAKTGNIVRIVSTPADPSSVLEDASVPAAKKEKRCDNAGVSWIKETGFLKPKAPSTTITVANTAEHDEKTGVSWARPNFLC
jgi:hypothetical protein